MRDYLSEIQTYSQPRWRWWLSYALDGMALAIAYQFGALSH